MGDIHLKKLWKKTRVAKKSSRQKNEIFWFWTHHNLSYEFRKQMENILIHDLSFFVNSMNSILSQQFYPVDFKRCQLVIFISKNFKNDARDRKIFSTKNEIFFFSVHNKLSYLSIHTRNCTIHWPLLTLYTLIDPPSRTFTNFARQQLQKDASGNFLKFMPRSNDFFGRRNSHWNCVIGWSGRLGAST